MSIFKELSEIDVSKIIEHKLTGRTVKNKKTGKEEPEKISYLSWMLAWGTLKAKYPASTFEVKRFEGKPYLHDPLLGYMVETSVTVVSEDDAATINCFLPALDNRFNSMMDTSYTFKKGKYDNYVEKARMFDINTAIMRCLVKNIALHGLGASLYVGEDLPVDFDISPEPKEPEIKKPEPKKTAEKKESVISEEEVAERIKLNTDLIVAYNNNSDKLILADKTRADIIEKGVVTNHKGISLELMRGRLAWIREVIDAVDEAGNTLVKIDNTGMEVNPVDDSFNFGANA